MRTFLLAGTALLTAGLAVARAQAPAAPSQGQLAAPYGAGPAPNNNNNAWGIANTPSGSVTAGPVSAIYPPNTDTIPAPGNIVIRLNGRVEVDVAADYSTVNTGRTASGAPNGYKLNPVGIGSFMRLYPGFDGVAANGLRYGAAIELRENFYGGNTVNSTNGPPAITSTGGVTSTVAPGGASSPSGNSSAETVYVRRAFTYLASDQIGILRLGQTDGVLGLFDNCVFTSECWDAGVMGINSSGQSLIAPSGVVIPFVWLDQSGAEYGEQQGRLPFAAVLRLRLRRPIRAQRRKRVQRLDGFDGTDGGNLQPSQRELHHRHIRQRCDPLVQPGRPGPALPTGVRPGRHQGVRLL